MKEYAFKFHTAYEMPDGTLDPTIYVATMGESGYKISAEGDEQDLYIDFTLTEAFEKVAMREWIVLRK